MCFIFRPLNGESADFFSLAKLLEPLQGGKIPVELLVKGKDEAVNKKNFEDVIEAMRQAGKKVGVFTKEAPRGPFVEEWKKIFEPAKAEFEEIDASLDVSNLLSIKDEQELVRFSRMTEHMCIADTFTESDASCSTILRWAYESIFH